MPKPRRPAAGVLGVLFVGALSTFISGRAAFAAPHPARLQNSSPTLFATNPAPRLKAAEKTKVPKPPPPPPTRTKGDGGGQSETKNSDDSDCTMDCVTSCFSFGDALMTSPTGPPASSPTTAFASEASRWAVGSEAWIVAPAETDSVALSDAPADSAHEALQIGTLPHGAHVVVVETHAMATGFWTRVRPFDGVEPNGWIPSFILSAAPAPKPAAPKPPKPDPRWGLRVLLAYGGLGPSDLNVEYGYGGWHADLQYLRLDRQWISGFGFGYRDYFGHPAQAYLSGTTLDDPQDSKLQMYEIGARAGQHYRDRSGFRFDWMLGPTLAYVHEHGNLHVFTVVPPSTLVPAGSRDDDLGRWAGGGEFRVNFAWRHDEDGDIGLHFNAFMYAWEGHEQHSLATDFVHSNIHGWDVGLTYSFFR